MTDLKLEKTIIGAILIDGSCAGQVISLIREDFFTDLRYRLIFRAIVALNKENSPIDALTVSVAIKKIDSSITAYEVSSITTGVSYAMTNPTNIEFNCRILNQLYISRELVTLGRNIENMANVTGSDPFDVISFISDKISKLTDFAKNNVVTLDAAIDLVIKRTNEVKSNGGRIGITTGFFNLDGINGGWHAPDLNILAARPGMGKTAFALAIAKNAVRSGNPCAFFSLEMSNIQLAARILASESQGSLSSNSIAKSNLNDFQYSILGTVAMNINGSNFFIDDTASLRLNDFRHRARKLVIENGVKLIIIDYLQLMVSDGGNREQEIASISRGLKGIAKDLNVPIIALSQLSREVEKRANKRPQLSDLRESGAIEQDADNIYFLFRPEYYDDLYPDNKYEYGNRFIDTTGLLLVDAAKGRNHGLGEVPLLFNGEFMTVENFNL